MVVVGALPLQSTPKRRGGRLRGFTRSRLNSGASASSAGQSHLGSPRQNPRGDLAAREVVRHAGHLAVAGRYTNFRRLEDDVVLDKEVVGTGMSGEVRLAHYRGTGVRCVVKTLGKKGLTDERRVEIDFEVEIYLSADHPHVARLERVYESEENIYLVMEYLSGGELFSALSQRQRYSEHEAAEAFRQILSAVSYLHSQRIVHCDLKLENFLYEREGSDKSNHLKLIDFGLAKRRAESGERLRHLCGSIHYVAPEVISRSYDEKADMWSLGIVLYMLLCGVMPWRGSDAEIVQRIRAGEPYFHPPLWNPLSAGAKLIVEGLLTLDPTTRLGALQALQHPWVSLRSLPAPPAVDRAVLHSLQLAARASPLRRACLSLAAWSFPSFLTDPLRAQFRSLDRGSTGLITHDDLRQAIGRDGDRHASEILSALGFSCSGAQSLSLSYSDFLAAAAYERRHELQAEELQLSFGRFDADGDGLVSALDLVAVFGEAFAAGGVLLLEAGGQEGDGTLTFQDFRDFMWRVDEGFKAEQCNEDLSETCEGFSETRGSSSDGSVDPAAPLEEEPATAKAASTRNAHDTRLACGCFVEPAVRTLRSVAQACGCMASAPRRPRKYDLEVASPSDFRGSQRSYAGIARSYLGPAALGS